MTKPRTTPPARAATAEDWPELVRLAGLAYSEMGFPDANGEWTGVAREQLRRRLGTEVNAFVVDDPGRPGELAACAAASLNHRLPSPVNPRGTVGYVQWVGTAAHCRRRGYARAAMRSLLDWLEDEGVGMVELHASPAAEGLYRDLGFGAPRNPCLRLPLVPGRSG